jgi:hypothetical protein
MSDPTLIGAATQIYALYDSLTQYPRYVGKTIQPLRNRLNSHLRTAKRNPKLPVHRWLAKCVRENRQVFIQLIEAVAEQDDWQSRERYWIEFMRTQGFSLLNLTAGGEGLPGHVFSDEHKNKIAAALQTGSSFSCLNCGYVFWRKKSAIDKGENKYCSKHCYQLAQVGKPKKSTIPAAAIAAAAAARKSQVNCKRGHPLSGENLFITTCGRRVCKECRKIHKANYRRSLA